MPRALIDIPTEVIEKLDVISKNRHVSRSQLIRSAIDLWLKEQKPTFTKKAFGILKNQGINDGLDFQKNVRGEWDK